MKINFKLTAIMVAIGLFAITSVSVTLLVRSQTSITGLSEQYALSMAHDSGENVGNFFELFLTKLETVADVMEQYQERAVSEKT